jgi:RNA polymerase sigma factor (sigma-70 family)
MVTQHDMLTAYVNKHWPAALRGLYDPADVVQDTCALALQYADAYDPERDPNGRRLLCTIARRRIIRLIERQRASRQVTDATILDGEHPAVGVLSPDAAVEARERAAAVRQAVGQLSPEHAAVLRDRYVDRIPAKVVAERMGRSPGAVDKLLQRAVLALAARLDPAAE